VEDAAGACVCGDRIDLAPQRRRGAARACVRRPPASTPTRLCQNVEVATAAISPARRPALATTVSIVLNAARTRSSASTLTSPSAEVCTGRSACAIDRAMGRPRESKRNTRRPDVPMSSASTSGARASRSGIASGSRSTARVCR
jgi:hypothetical protein